MASYVCPFCNQIMSITPDTLQSRTISFGTMHPTRSSSDPQQFEFRFYSCPNCEETSVVAEGKEKFRKLFINVRPQFAYTKYPDYIPEAILSDYEEACAIRNLSPKASATLCRRCLQGMIRDFWGITKSRLVDEIDILKNLIPASQWKVIDALRRIGNIGAHMESDVNTIINIDEGEAEKLIQLIEHLIKAWYIERHESESLIAEIINIDDKKQAAKKKAQ